MINNILTEINNFLYTYPLLILLVGTGIWFSLRTRFVQVRFLREALRVLGEKAEEEDGKKQVSSFQARAILRESPQPLRQAARELCSGCGSWQ